MLKKTKTESEALAKKSTSKSNLLADGRMPFGKHRGELIEDLPFDYLEWAVGNLHEGDVLDALKAEYERRWM